jgi:hypothetical protein
LLVAPNSQAPASQGEAGAGDTSCEVLRAYHWYSLSAA